MLILTGVVTWLRRSPGFVNDDWAFLFRDATSFSDLATPHAGHLVAGSIALYKALQSMFGFHYTAFSVVLMVIPFFVSRFLLVVVLREHGLGRGLAVGTAVAVSLVGEAGQHRLVHISNDASLILALSLGWLLLEPTNRLRGRARWVAAAAGVLVLVTVNEQVIVPVAAFTIVAMLRHAPRRLRLLGAPAFALVGLWLLRYGGEATDRSRRELLDPREIADIAVDALDIAAAYFEQLFRVPAPMAVVLAVAAAMMYAFDARRAPLSGLEQLLLITLAIGIVQRAAVISDLESGADALGPRHFKHPLTELTVLAGFLGWRLARMVDPRRFRVALPITVGVAAGLLFLHGAEFIDRVDLLERGATRQRNTIEVLHRMDSEPVVDPDRLIGQQMNVERVRRLEAMGWRFDGPTLAGSELSDRVEELRGLLRFSIEPVTGPGATAGMFTSTRTGERLESGCTEISDRVLRLTTTTGGQVFVEVAGSSARLRIRADDEHGPSRRNVVVVPVGGNRRWIRLGIAPVPSGLTVRLGPTNTDRPMTFCT